MELLHALRCGLETLIMTRVEGHIVDIQDGPPWFLGHALRILPDLTETIRRHQDELQTIDLTDERLERESLADATFAFEKSEGHMAPFHERGEQGPQPGHVRLLIDDLIAGRFGNLDGLELPLESRFKDLVFGKRVLVVLMHERDDMSELAAPIPRTGQSTVQLGFRASVGVAERQNLLPPRVIETWHLSHPRDKIRRHSRTGAGNPARRNSRIGGYSQRLLGEDVVHIDQQGVII